MAQLYITSNGTVIYPLLPIEREDVLVAEDRRHRSGQLRRAYIATKKRLRYSLTDATEAERTAWLTAHPWNTSYSHTDERGDTRTVVTLARVDALSRTTPLVEGGLSTTGDAFYDLSVEVEEV